MTHLLLNIKNQQQLICTFAGQLTHKNAKSSTKAFNIFTHNDVCS